jgi:formylglycine-generating enzyme required for sulfatase activity
MRTLLLLLAAAAALPAQVGSKSVVPIGVGRKVALVVGNSVYTELEPIPAAANDADDMAATLRRLGFEVVVKKNLRVNALITEIAAFKAIIHPGDLALLYYSGHGASLGEENYLLPVDYDLPVDPDIAKRHAYAMSDVRDKLEDSGALVRVLIFDACRGPALRNKGTEGNPASVEGRLEGTVIAFASAHKQDSFFDARDRNSLYTKRLLAALNSPDSDLEGLLKGVQRDVYRDTAHRQTPFLYAFLSGPLYLTGAPHNDVVAKPDIEAWKAIANSAAPEDFDDFVKSFPGSDYAPTAKLKAAALRRATPHEQTRVNPTDGERYVWIAPGTFAMGCSPGDSDCGGDESPAHRVEIAKGFWMAQTPATVGAWKKYRAATKAPALPDTDIFGGKMNENAGNDSLPAVAMTWDEAKNYCEWTGGRLPTEAEWEYAARAGTTGARYGNLDDIAWYGDNSGNQRIDSTAMRNHNPENFSRRLFENGNGPKPVGQKAPNAWHLYDMLGNVWQWTADRYGEKYDSRTLRGGSFNSYPKRVRASARSGFEPGERAGVAGVRCVAE